MHLNPEIVLVSSSVSSFTNISEVEAGRLSHAANFSKEQRCWNSSAAYEYTDANVLGLATHITLPGLDINELVTFNQHETK